MPFKTYQSRIDVPNDPEQLFRDLPRGTGDISALWTHQSDIIRAYVEQHANTPDIALELPTGTGKTLPGLLIAEWVRLRDQCHVIYACPTQQLARQTASAAQKAALSVSLLIGRNQDWPVQDRTAFAAAERVAVTTYSSIFNSSPKLESAQLVIFDDAHAAEQYVAEAYSVRITRADAPEEYTNSLNAIAPGLDGLYLEQLRGDSGTSALGSSPRLVLPAQDEDMLRNLDRALAAISDSDIEFRFRMIRRGLASCLVFVEPDSIYIRPLLPPTHENRIFRDARQRMYLSATLGRGGELERAFGRARIQRLPLPSSSQEPRAGRRFFLFPALVEDATPNETVEAIAQRVGKALILTPDAQSARGLSTRLAGERWPTFDNQNIDTSLSQFATATRGVCGLANRYDGIDLPGDACRLVILHGLPDALSPMERFLNDRARAGSTSAERIRTRVIQGTGRCTRNPDDTAIVAVCGPDLTNYLSRPDTRNALRPELQAEIDFGREHSALPLEQLLQLVQAFLDPDRAAFREGESYIASRRRDVTVNAPEGSEILAQSANIEVAACAEAWSGRWSEAGQELYEAAAILGQGEESIRGYRAFLLHLSGTWKYRAGVERSSAELQSVGLSLTDQAIEAARPSHWPREMKPLAAEQYPTADNVDRVGAQRLGDRLRTRGKSKVRDQVDEMLANLDQPQARPYETALRYLGEMIGAEAWKPKEGGRCDSVWRWDDELWVVIEAKSDQRADALISRKDLRQIGDQLETLRHDLDASEIPESSFALLVTPRQVLAPDAIGSAGPHVFLTTPEDILAIANSIRLALDELIERGNLKETGKVRRRIVETYQRHGVLPSQLLDRLTKRPAGDPLRR